MSANTLVQSIRKMGAKLDLDEHVTCLKSDGCCSALARLW